MSFPDAQRLKDSRDAGLMRTAAASGNARGFERLTDPALNLAQQMRNQMRGCRERRLQCYQHTRILEEGGWPIADQSAKLAGDPILRNGQTPAVATWPSQFGVHMLTPTTV